MTTKGFTLRLPVCVVVQPLVIYTDLLRYVADVKSKHLPELKHGIFKARYRLYADLSVEDCPNYEISFLNSEYVTLPMIL